MMWPVRTRRGTRKRCAALFIVGLCAAVMILTRPFVTTPGGSNQLVDPMAPMALISTSNNLTTSSNGLLRSNDSSTVDFNSSSRGPNNFQQGALASTSDKNELGPPPPVSIVIKPEYIQEPLITMMKLEESLTEKSSSSDVDVKDGVGGGDDDTNSLLTSTPVPQIQTTGLSNSVTSQSLMTSGPIMAAPTTKSAEVEAVHGPGNVIKGPVVYVLTPTFPRMEQMAELTRLGQTLMHISDLHWIVVDDTRKKSADVESLLKRTGIPYTYLVAQMPEAYRKKKGSKPKGVANRLAGLKWIKEHARDDGVMFFADDDNSYDIRLFEEMRWTKKVSMWPVGLVTHLGVSTPVVKNGHVVDFYDGWISTRKFPVDMAGFAVNVKFLKTRQNVTMPFKAGFEEDGFLRSLNISLNDIEPKADNCTKIYVWHTKTVGNKMPQKISAKDRQRFKNSNLFSLPHIV